MGRRTIWGRGEVHSLLPSLGLGNISDFYGLWMEVSEGTSVPLSVNYSQDG